MSRREASSIRRPPLGEQGVNRCVEANSRQIQNPGTQWQVTIAASPAQLCLQKTSKNSFKILLIFKRFLMPFWLPKSLNLASKMHPQSIQNPFKIPPALWAAGGLAAPQSKNPSTPPSQLPWGGVYHFPYPSPWTLDGRILRW